MRYLQGDEAVGSQLQGLAQFLGVPVPDVQLAAVLGAHQRRVEAL